MFFSLVEPVLPVVIVSQPLKEVVEIEVIRSQSVCVHIWRVNVNQVVICIKIEHVSIFSPTGNATVKDGPRCFAEELLKVLREWFVPRGLVPEISFNVGRSHIQVCSMEQVVRSFHDTRLKECVEREPTLIVILNGPNVLYGDVYPFIFVGREVNVPKGPLNEIVVGALRLAGRQFRAISRP